MSHVRQRNQSRLLSVKCEEMEQILKSPERQSSEYTYIDERDSGVYSLKNGLRYEECNALAIYILAAVASEHLAVANSPRTMATNGSAIACMF